MGEHCFENARFPAFRGGYLGRIPRLFAGRLSDLAQAGRLQRIHQDGSVRDISDLTSVDLLVPHVHFSKWEMQLYDPVNAGKETLAHAELDQDRSRFADHSRDPGSCRNDYSPAPRDGARRDATCVFGARVAYL